jgi:hypothetical protein
LAFDPHLAAVLFNQGAANVQAQPHAGNLIGGLVAGPEETAEKIRLIGYVYPNTAI